MLFSAVFFSLDSWQLGLVIFAIVGGACVVGVVIGRYLRRHSEHYREGIGALQGALLGLVGLILAFGLTLAVNRYQDRRADVVNEANTIGTAYLRAQTLAEPQRSRSLTLLRRYNDLAIRLTRDKPVSASFRATTAEQDRLQQTLWQLGGEAINAQPRNSSPRLYIDSLNAMIDQQGVRIAGLNNHPPNAVLVLELFGAALALGMLALYISVLGRGLLPVALAAVVVTFLVLVTFDLDRPTRGLITVPASPLLAEKATMSLPPAAPAPR
jgi:ABC-type multidrug transport system fused ATPase/permease subunit